MDYKVLRDKMVTEQICARGIHDKRVIDAMRRVERHWFVPSEEVKLAYCDFPVGIGAGQTISQPFMVALMTQALELDGAEKILEIGTGSGYQTAILAEICKEVYSIERISSLVKKAKEALRQQGYQNVKVFEGDGTLGLPEHGPYDRILITAGAPSAQDNLLDQLNDNGYMVVPIGNRFSQMLTVFKKKGGKIQQTDVCSCIFVPLVGKFGWS